MFHKARFKLTAWYLVIIMLISICFSVAIYEILTYELDRVERMQRIRQERQFSITDGGAVVELRPRAQRPPMIDPEIIEETKARLKSMLISINLGILGFSSLAGYFLAGRTLRPIKEMVDEQNRFIADASHELRTPLTSLKSEIEVNLRDKKLNLTDAKKILESNLEEVNNLQYLSDNLIKLTQYQKINGNIVFEKVQLEEVAKEAIKKVANLARRKKITIKNEIKTQMFEADKQSLIELLVILLDNAIKYSEKNTAIEISSSLSGHLGGGGLKSVVIKVQDQGVGIDKKDLPHLFDRFYRSDKSRTKKGIDGYGLGLSIAKQIVEKHKGVIKVESEVDKGTTIFVYLPLKH